MLSEQIVNKIQKKRKERRDTVAQDYFVGITQNPEQRLFNEHRVNPANGIYTYCQANTTIEAKKAFDELLNEDMNGFPNSEENDGTYVYCYFIDWYTKECHSYSE